MSWIPTEHGGYAMLLFPIASALALPGAGPDAWALATLVVVVYLSHRVILDAAGGASLAGLARRTAAGQLLASLALSSASIPVALLAGATPAVAITLAAVWMLGFTITALAVRSVIERGCPARARAFTRAALAVAAIALVGLAWLARDGRIPAAAPLCLMPLLIVSCALALHPPSPRRLRVIGWSLATACALTLGQLVTLW